MCVAAGVCLILDAVLKRLGSLRDDPPVPRA